VGNQPAVAIICGPTGSGKTAAALTLSRDHPIEIISADSRQIIKHLDIGTAKPTPEERRSTTFHLLDVIEPGERYSAYRFLVEAEAAINDVLSRGRIPLVVGGTGLYLNALTDGVVEIPEDPEGRVRSQLEADLDRLGVDAMHARLAEIDPDEARKTHPNNAVKVIRALEIFGLAGVSKTHLVASGSYKKSAHRYVSYCLLPPREILYEQIEVRVDKMMQSGWLGELQQLLANGQGESIRKANVIGYQELLGHLEGQYSLAEAVELIKQNTRRYAKRQVTWFRHQSDSRCFAKVELLLDAIGIDSEITKGGQRT
jgi:tRNA dimethylallyltransferase